MDGFGVSQSAAQRAITRLQQDQLIEKMKYGVYRKVVSELP
jgi:Mn-dependent DtxR family transcriptional regulator